MATKSFLLCALLSFAAAEPQCRQNDCFDVVRDGRQGGHGGCGAFLQKTLIPPAATRTVLTTVSTTTTSSTIVTSTASIPTTLTTTVQDATTSTITTTTTPGASRKVKRAAGKTTTVSATTVPPYARGNCKNVAQYASACSCFGVEYKTTTARTPTVVQTSKKTTTAEAKETATITTTVSYAAITSTVTSITATVTTTATVGPPPCPTDPIQLVINNGFEFDRYNASPWVTAAKFKVERTTSPYAGRNQMTFFTSGPNGMVYQILNTYAYTLPVKYTFTAAFGFYFRNDASQGYLEVELDGNSIFPSQIACPDTTQCPTVRDYANYRTVNITNSVPFLSANPVLSINGYLNPNPGPLGSSVAIVDEVYLTVQCADLN